MKAVVAAFNQEKALVGAFSVFTNLWMELFETLLEVPLSVPGPRLEEEAELDRGVAVRHHGQPHPGDRDDPPHQCGAEGRHVGDVFINNVIFREGSNSQSAVNEGFDDICPIIGIDNLSKAS